MLRQYLKKKWMVKFNNRLAVTIAYCQYWDGEKPVRELHLSSYFFHRLSKAEQKHILLHEIAHCIQVEEKGYCDHSKDFKEICERIGCLASSRWFDKHERSAIKKAEKNTQPSER